MVIQTYTTIDGKEIKVDKDKRYRMPNNNGSGISYPLIGNLDGLMSAFQEERFKGQTSKMAKNLIDYFNRYLYGDNEESRSLFIATHSTPLLSPRDGSKSNPSKLGATYDELLNTYRIFEQIAKE